jgi:hypothetical protein
MNYNIFIMRKVLKMESVYYLRFDVDWRLYYWFHRPDINTCPFHYSTNRINRICRVTLLKDMVLGGCVTLKKDVSLQ